MRKKLICVLLALALTTGLFSGCSRSKSLNFSYPVTDDVRTFDPQYTTAPTARTVITNCFDCLVAQDADGNIIPAAAESWEQHGRMYTFRLRADAAWKIPDVVLNTFADKIPKTYAPVVTAADFVFACRRLASPETDAPAAYIFDSIQNFTEARAGLVAPDTIAVTASSDYTLTITTAYDDPDFLTKLSMPEAAPCHEEFFELCGGRYGLGRGYLIYNGPYYLTRWEEKSLYRISKDDEYTGLRAVGADAVWFYYNEDAQKMNDKLADGVYSAGITNITAFSPDTVDSDYTVTEINDVLHALIFNCSAGTAATPALRQALILSADNDIFSGTQSYFPAITAASLPDGVTENKLPAENVPAAKTALKAGLAELGTEKAEITVLCTAAHEDMLKQQMQHWQKTLGITMNVKINAVAANDLLNAVNSGDYEAAFYPLQAASDSYIDFLSAFVSGAAENLTGYASESYDKNFTALCGARTATAQAEAANLLLKELRDNAVFLPALQGSTYFVRNANAAGVYFRGSTSQLYFTK